MGCRIILRNNNGFCRGVAVIEAMYGKIKKTVFKLLALLAAVSIARILPEMGWRAADFCMTVFGCPQFGFFWDIVHHTVQMLLAILIMALPIWGKTFSDWGFNNEKKEMNKKIIMNFLFGFIVFFTGGKIVYLLIMGWPPALVYNSQSATLLQTVLFRSTMPGLSEEILFRALVIGILMTAWKENISIGKVRIYFSGILSALIFVIAHVGYGVFPFEILYFNIGQMISAFVFGLFYSIAYIETGSLIAPIVSHNIVDGIGTVIDWVLTGIVG